MAFINDIQTLTGAQAIMECLKREGADVVFGYPGAAVLPMYEALRNSGVRHVLTRTEQGAGHAASGYARMSGRPGVCFATSGPGATNLFTAVATAYSDSIPMIAVTGQVATYNLGRDVFQEVDTTGAAEPFTKYTYLIKSAADIGRVFREAFHICSTGRKGPVLIDVPVDVQQEAAEFNYLEKIDIRGYKPRSVGNALQVRRVAEAICAAKRPLICLGGGVFLSSAKKIARDFCEKAGLPVVTTLMGISALPRGHRLYYGMLGQSGDSVANGAVAGADVLVIIGARVGDRAINRPEDLSRAVVVHIDIDSAEIGKNVGTTIPLVGDAARVLEQLAPYNVSGDWGAWVAELDAMRGQVGAARAKDETSGQGAWVAELDAMRGLVGAAREKDEIAENVRGGDGSVEIMRADNEFAACGRAAVDPAEFVRKATALLPEDAIYVADVGQNQIWSAKNFSSEGRFMTTGGMGTMGYSLPAAIGAQIARPGKTVMAVMGDGAFQMSMNELATIKTLGLPIKIVIMNNSSLGLVRELQIKSGAPPFATDISGFPDYGAIAAAYGIPYSRAENTRSAISAAEAALACSGAHILECAVDPEEQTT